MRWVCDFRKWVYVNEPLPEEIESVELRAKRVVFVLPFIVFRSCHFNDTSVRVETRVDMKRGFPTPFPY